ncbi:putative serine/threonine-protein kinase SIS8 isoform X1 [Bidens hawaiensis]|uniref:putative serine/threonine-protein kinase SIS8 isoform X1 n=2 Tax=Bidens hawaiensis TaxID=980011 RepID=UPI00404971E9
MKSLLKKLHIRSNQSQSQSQSLNQSSESSEVNISKQPLSSITRWLNSVTSKRNQSPKSIEEFDSITSSQLDAAISELRGFDDNNRDAEAEEEHQIQLALELSAREDPEAVQIEAVKQISLGSCVPENTPAEIVACRYWNYNALSYDDKIVDGFYDLHGVLTGPTSSKMPSFVELQGTPVSDNVTWETVLVDKAADSKLLELEQRALEIAVKSVSESVDCAGQSLVQRLAVLVSDHMGGPVRNPDNMLVAWRDFSSRLKGTIGSMVLPLGSLKIGLARHRALLFKVLADSVGIPCCLVKGKQYTGSDKVAMNFIKLGDGREYIVDLMADPGTVIPSDTLGGLGGSNVDYEESLSSSPWSRDEDSSYAASSTSNLTTSSVDYMENNNDTHSSGLSQPIKSVLEPKKSLPQFPQKAYVHGRSPSWTEGISSPAVRKMKVNDVSQYMMEAAKENPKLAQKLHDVLLESGVVAPPDLFTQVYEDEPSKSPTDSQSEGQGQNQSSQPRLLPPLPRPQRASSRSEANPAEYMKSVPAAAAVAMVAATKTMTDQNIQLPVAAAATVTAAVMAATTTSVLDSSPLREGDMEAQYEIGQDGERISDRSTGNESTVSDVPLDDVADCEIVWEDITLGERIGLGSYGEVYRGEWHGTEVAVKKFLDQEITTESLEEFRSEVRIMKRVRHPNVVLFMGAVTRAPHLSIVTEFLPRGSLYRLLHRPNNQLDIRRRLRMAFDTARGMNYLHNCTPVIVHRDLKTPNLLVDKNWVVKVSDFGLSRMKYSTFLSSRSTAGTAEWMAPEVLRNEPSDEKSDVYSFGVVLWELCTLQQPWGGMNPMQVVGAVGFQHRRLEIPEDMDPIIADIITKCWQTDPKLRPTFADILAALKPLQRLNASSKTG